MGYKIERYMVGPVGTNCYFLINEDTKEAVIVDPGAAAGAIRDKLNEKGLNPQAILLTHGHFDHADGVEELLSLFPDKTIPVYAYRG